MCRSTHRKKQRNRKVGIQEYTNSQAAPTEEALQASDAWRLFESSQSLQILVHQPLHWGSPFEKMSRQCLRSPSKGCLKRTRSLEEETLIEQRDKSCLTRVWTIKKRKEETRLAVRHYGMRKHRRKYSATCVGKDTTRALCRVTCALLLSSPLVTCTERLLSEPSSLFSASSDVSAWAPKDDRIPCDARTRATLSTQELLQPIGEIGK